LDEYNQRKVVKVEDSAAAASANGSGSDVTRQKQDFQKCRICNVFLSSELSDDHEVDHFRQELVEHVKRLADKEPSRFWKAGVLQCGHCGVVSSQRVLKDQWLEVARHMGKSHGLLDKLIWERGLGQNGRQNVKSSTAVGENSNKRRRSFSNEPDAAKKLKVGDDVMVSSY
jgi:hypothetical protein